MILFPGMFLLCIILVTFLVYTNARFPENSYIKSIRDWQTFIGAIVGFFAVSIAILLEGRLSEDRDISRKRNNEIALLRNTISDVDRVITSINHLTQTFDVTTATLTPSNCMSIIKIVKTHPIRRLSISRRLDIIGGEVSAATYVVLSVPVDILGLYSASVTSLLIPECASKSEQIIDFYLQMANETKEELENSKLKMIALAVELESK